MPEKLYGILLKLYPKHYRRAYGDDALRLVTDRARDEKGFPGRLRLWLDLLGDLAISLPREYSKALRRRTLAASPVDGAPLFQLVTGRSPNPALVFAACLATGALFWTCITAVGRSRTFPARFPADSNSLQAVVQSDVARARTATEEESAAAVGVYSFCVTARREIADNALRPILRFGFAPPGGSGEALLDGKIVRKFRNEQRLWISADLPAGNHWFVVRVDKRAENASIAADRDFKSCPAQ